MSNFTSTIEIPNSRSDYKTPETGWDAVHYNKHYKKVVKPIFDKIEFAVKKIESTQKIKEKSGYQHILWNKCRYFECTVYNKEVLRFVSQSSKVKIKYNNMLVGNRFKLEAVVRAFNKKGIYCFIKQDWI